MWERKGRGAPTSWILLCFWLGRSWCSTTSSPKALWYTSRWQLGVWYSSERLCSNAALPIPWNQCEWPRKWIKSNRVSFLGWGMTESSVPPILTSVFDDLAFILHFKKLKQYQQLSWVLFSPSYLQGIQLLVYERSQDLRVLWSVCSNNVKDRSFLHVGKFYSLIVVGSYQAASQQEIKTSYRNFSTRQSISPKDFGFLSQQKNNLERI